MTTGTQDRPVKEPTRRGFGTRVVERSIPYDLKGEAVMEYAPEGVRARFVIPAAFVRAAPGTPMTPSEPILARPRPEDLPRDVLMVEDNMIIALDAEDMLRRMGVKSVRAAGCVAQAMSEIDKQVPEFALLDINLGTETSFAIAERLASMGVRFAFTTGYGEDIAFPPKLLGVARVRKPYTADTLAAVLRPR